MPVGAKADGVTTTARGSMDWLREYLGKRVAQSDPDRQFVRTDLALYGDFMYVEPLLRRAGLLDMQRFFDELPADRQANPVDALAAALQAAVRLCIPEDDAHLREVPVDLAPIAGLHGWHALDPASGAQAIAVSAQHVVGLLRANVWFAYLLSSHLWWQSPGGKYERDAGLIARFLKLKTQPRGFVATDGELTDAARDVSRLVERLFDRLIDPEPWILDAEGIEWLCSVGLTQQLFVILRELGLAKEKWASGAPLTESGVHVRGGSQGPCDAEAEDRADAWAAQVLIRQVGSGRLHVHAWEGDVSRFIADHRWPVPSEPEELVTYAVFLYFEYLEAAVRLGRHAVAASHRPPRDRYDEIGKCLGVVFPTRRAVAEVRELLSTVATATQFGEHKR